MALPKNGSRIFKITNKNIHASKNGRPIVLTSKKFSSPKNQSSSKKIFQKITSPKWLPEKSSPKWESVWTWKNFKKFPQKHFCRLRLEMALGFLKSPTKISMPRKMAIQLSLLQNIFFPKNQSSTKKISKKFSKKSQV